MTKDITFNEDLHYIMKNLRNQENAKEQSHEELKLSRRRDSFAQICSMYAVIAIFIATLGVGFLTYTHDTFGDRPDGTPPKHTDHVTTAFLLLSVLFSISSSIALGAGSSPALILSIPSQMSPIQEILSLFPHQNFITIGIRKFFQEKRDESECTSKNNIGQTKAQCAQTQIDAEQQVRQRSTPQSVESEKMDLSKNVVNRLRFLVMVKRKNRKEFNFVISMLVMALLSMVGSLFSLAVGGIVFCWAELGKTVSVIITAGLVIPLLVIGCAATICKCTLFSRARQSNVSYEARGNLA